MTLHRRMSPPLALAVLLALCAHCEAAPQSSNAQRPNIIIILADDMGFGDVACQNPDSKIPTPFLDKLATQGMRFTDAHSPSAVCTPTRYSLLTGTYAWRSALKRSVLWPWDAPLIDEDTLTLPQMLSEQGYTTACIGKWHLGWNWPTTDGSAINDIIPLGKFDNKIRNPWHEKVDFSKSLAGGPTARGLGYYFGDDVPNFPPYGFIENDRMLALPKVPKPEPMFGLPGPMVEGWDLTAVMPTLAKKAVDFIKAPARQAPFGKKANAPFFLYLSLTAPHTPIAPTEEFIGKSGAHRYGDFVNEVDWLVGQVMDALSATGQEENTLLIFTSDNGSPGRDGENMNGKPNTVRAYGHNPSHIYRGIKADIWEGGHRVPFIARWPKRIAAASASDEVITHTDFMATCAALTGATFPQDAARDSYNLLPLLLGEEQTEPLREATVHHSINGMFAIRQGDWKFIDGKGSGGWSGKGAAGAPPVQLFNLAKDPREEHNLQEQHPDIVQRLSALLARYKRDGRSAIRPTNNAE
ncbi:MAG: arylsulfatase [Candidatus Hydrogenedentes bacterium]|nr:arylsulfatase [Candidatus Hydrogenedentota bacterium]